MRCQILTRCPKNTFRCAALLFLAAGAAGIIGCDGYAETEIVLEAQGLDEEEVIAAIESAGDEAGRATDLGWDRTSDSLTSGVASFHLTNGGGLDVYSIGNDRWSVYIGMVQGPIGDAQMPAKFVDFEKAFIRHLCGSAKIEYREISRDWEETP